MKETRKSKRLEEYWLIKKNNKVYRITTFEQLKKEFEKKLNDLDIQNAKVDYVITYKAYNELLAISKKIKKYFDQQKSYQRSIRNYERDKRNNVVIEKEDLQLFFRSNGICYEFDFNYNEIDDNKVRQHLTKVFYKNEKYTYEINRTGELFRTRKRNLKGPYRKKQDPIRMTGFKNDKGLTYVEIDGKKYLLAKIVYDNFGDVEKLKNIGPSGVIMYRDHDKNNLRIENLDYVSRAEFNKTRIEKKRKKYRPQRYKKQRELEQ
ncbi:hypothetical protein DXC21_05795 [Coprobacillus sp. OM08-19]|jgi:hypothetical protein|uniref:hypothetical protein n=1 Tax=Faecalibacillus intestinalis TaxID=1982626 RepID=UPI000E4AF5B1|nr:hypothetical protein [Faecalibacillus intestinalis]RGI25211.1 hypothetical protein DXC21_05795 [Coprobacillus sp. OM08-19]